MEMSELLASEVVSSGSEYSKESVDGLNMTAANGTNDTLMTLDEYLNKSLPLHLEQLILDANQKELFDSAAKSLLSSTLLAKQQQSLQIAPIQPQSSFSSQSFAEGLIVGQLSVIVALIFVIKFFVFSEGGTKTATAKSVGSASSFMDSTKNSILSTIIKRGGKDGLEIDDKDNEKSRQINSILEKTYYNVETHSPESLDWFNVLIAQTIHQFREEALQKNNIINSLNDFIERRSNELPQYLDQIKITEVDIGDDFPIFSNCIIQYSPNSNKKRLEAKIDIDLSDRLALGIETKLLLNYPKPFSAALPIKLTVSIVRFQACLTVSLTTDEQFVPTSEETSDDEMGNDKGYYLMFSFNPEYRMELEVKSLIGARSKLENIPKIASLIEYQISKWFVERCVEPRFQFVKLPSMWPRSKNTRKEKTDTDDSVSVKSND
ncbi:Mmm1 [Kluyveromyces lactis]|nr:Mmm1 [Kluyveromyces lactis]